MFKNRRTSWIIAAVLAALVGSACGGSEDVPSADRADDAEAEGGFDPASFSDPTNIDNPYMPLQAGTALILEGFTVEEDEEIPHRIEIIVTDLVKEIAGIQTRVLLEKDISDEEPIELELAFRAQDDDGNVWHMGEYTETYEDTDLVGGLFWAQGTPQGAFAGIVAPADPQAGTPDRAQGFAPEPYNWTDRGRVVEVGASTEVEAGSFDDVIIIEEFNEDEPGAIQTKYYAPGVGLVRIGWAGDDPDQEEMELVERVELSEDELAEAREVAFGIERRAVSYAETPPLERAP